MGDLIKVSTCGSVDDGKSTLLGRILFETNNIKTDQSEYLKKKTNGKNLDYSLLLDGLIDEKTQGITIDIAFKYFSINKHSYILIDSPGHEEFTRNMASAASLTDISIILIDATKGITNQTLRHLKIISIFQNIQKVIVCINKLDKLNFDKKRYDIISDEIKTEAKKLNLKLDYIIPISALYGDNINLKSDKTPYYKQKPLIEILKDPNLKISKSNSLLISVQNVIKNNTQRIYYAKNICKSFNHNEQLFNLRTNQKVEISNLYNKNTKISKISKGINFGLTTKNQISILPGDLITNKISDFIKTNSVKCELICTSNTKIYKSTRYQINLYNYEVKGFFSDFDIKSPVDVNTIFHGTLETENSIYISIKKNIDELTRVTIVDLETNETIAFGKIKYSLDRGSNVIFSEINKSKIKNIPCIWFTGYSASGKTTIAKRVQKQLSKRGLQSYILDGDNLRSTINKDLGFAIEDRNENNRRTAHIAKILAENGIIPIVSTISPTNISREVAKSIFKDDFILVYLSTPLEVCIERNPKKIYSNSKYNSNITGIGSTYETPVNPEIILDTSKISISRCEKFILKYLEDNYDF